MKYYPLIPALLLIVCLFAIFYDFDSTPSASDLEKSVLRVALWQSASNPMDMAVFDSFMRDNPDVEIDLVSLLSSNYNTSLESYINGQQVVDVFFIQHPYQLSGLINKQILKPLDFLISQSDLADTELFGLEELRSPQDNALYALPYKTNRYYLYYNKDLFDAAGMSYPEDGLDWEEFIQIGEALIRRFDQAGLSGKHSIMLLPDSMELSEMGLIDAKSLCAKQITKESDFLSTMDLLLKSDALLSFSYCYEKNYCRQTFESGDVAMFITDNDYVYTLLQDMEQHKFDFNWGICAQPYSKDETPPQTVVPVAIYRNTSNPEAAWRFISYLCGQDGAGLLAENLFIPAYSHEIIYSALQAEAVENSISAGLYAPLDSTSCFLCPGETQPHLILSCYEDIERYMLGLIDREQCIEAIQEKLSDG